MVELSRRHYLALAGAGVAAGGGGYVLLSGSETGSRGSYLDWVASPADIRAETEEFQSDAIVSEYTRFEPLRANESALAFDLDSYEQQTLRIGSLDGADRSEITRKMGMSRGTIYFGSFDPDRLTASLAEPPESERGGAYEGYELVRAPRGQVWAVGESEVVFGLNEAVTKVIVDTGLGTRDGAVTTDDAFGRLTDALGDGTSGGLVKPHGSAPDFPEKPKDMIASGEMIEVEGETTRFEFVYLVESAPPESELDRMRDALGDYDTESLSVTSDDSSVTVSGSFETAALTDAQLTHIERFVPVPLPRQAGQ